MIGFALMGCGRISTRHADAISTLNKEGLCKLVGVCDPVQTKREAVSSKYGVPAFPSLSAMMEELADKIDVVNILTPSGDHMEHCLEVAGHKKHVVVEKPMALRLEDADRMIEACDKEGVRLFVVKQNRYNLAVQKVREAYEKGRFGKIVMGTVRVRWCRSQAYYNQDPWRGTWKYDGGVFANQASHHIDLLQWFLGDVESVYAVSRTALVDIEVEDTAVAILKFASGAIGVVEATTATRPKDLEGSLSILGEFGSVEIGGFAVNSIKQWNFETEDKEDEMIRAKYHENPPNVYGYGHYMYLKNVIENIRHEKSALVGGLAGRKSLELISAFYESIEIGKEVRFRFRPKYCRLGAPNMSQETRF